jgi:hypothetical protein
VIQHLVAVVQSCQLLMKSSQFAVVLKGRLAHPQQQSTQQHVDYGTTELLHQIARDIRRLLVAL